MMKNLIINADDLGLTRGINRGILDAHTKGILTSATIMPTGSAFEHAVRHLAEVPRLGVGIHLSLTGGRGEFLSAGMRGHSRSFRGYRSFLREVRSGRFSLDLVNREVDLQFRRCLDMGLKLTHIDSHHHIHLYPPIMQVVLTAGRRYGLERIRIIREAYPLRRTLRYSPRWVRWLVSRPTLEWLSLAGIGRISQKKIHAFGLRGPDRFFGTYLNHFSSQTTLDWILDCIPEGSSELMVHPGYCDDELRAISRLDWKRKEVLDLLTSENARAAIERRGIRLASFADL